jgi:hypothetical protein
MKTFSFWIVLLTGLLMLFIGGRFLLSPAVAETAYGIHITTGDFSFHYIKGIRDIFSGVLVIVLLFAKEYRALGFALLCAAIIPLADFLIVMSHADYEVNKLYPHLTAIVICVVFGVYYVGMGKKTIV